MRSNACYPADTSSVFKLSDVDINAIKTTTYRSHGTATTCLGGACTVDTTVFHDASCVYSAYANSTICNTAWLDVDLTVPGACQGYHPCTWHFGLTSVKCPSIDGGDCCVEVITNHSGDTISAGDGTCAGHAYNGRSGEDPSIDVWVR